MKNASERCQAELQAFKKHSAACKSQIASLGKEIKLHYKNRCQSKHRIMDLEKRLKISSDDFSYVKKLFSPSQLAVLRDPVLRFTNCWSEEDMSNAVELYSCSPAAYELLQTKGFPLPEESDVTSWRYLQDSNDLDELQNAIDERKSKTMKFSHSDSYSNHKGVDSTNSDEDVLYVETNEDEIITLESEDESNHDTEGSIQHQNEFVYEFNIEQEEFDIEECIQHTTITKEGGEADGDIIGDCYQEINGNLFSFTKSQLSYFSTFSEVLSEDLSQDS